ncbi:APY Apyrase, partial [Pseudoatta argentina]
MYVLLLVLILFQVCLGFTGRGLFYPGRADLFELSIIHLNDFHARFEQTSPYSGVCREDHKKDCIGGIARVYTAVNQLMKEQPNAIFLNAGDHFQGTLWYNIHRWNVTAVFMNMLPHDAMYSMVRVIFLLDFLSNTEKLKFLNEVETVNDEAKRLKETGVNIIIVLSHCGLDVDRIMAAKCPLIDVIVGGHSHTFLYSGSPPFIDTPQDEYPVVVTQNETDRTVLIVQAAAYAKYLGNLTVWFDDQALKPWKKVVDETALKKVGTTRILRLHNCYNQECNMGNLITDAMVNAVVDGAENKTHWTYAAVACMNPGGIRSSLEESDITYGDLMMVLPFENTWDTIELTGESIILEMRQMLVWSGLKITYKKVNETRSLVNVKIRCQACEYPVFENLVDNQWYRMIISNFLMNDGDGFHILKNKSRNHKTGTVDINHFIKYVTKISPLLIGTERRINIIE